MGYLELKKALKEEIEFSLYLIDIMERNIEDYFPRDERHHAKRIFRNSIEEYNLNCYVYSMKELETQVKPNKSE